jgi:hypothetical protein
MFPVQAGEDFDEAINFLHAIGPENRRSLKCLYLFTSVCNAYTAPEKSCEVFTKALILKRLRSRVVMAKDKGRTMTIVRSEGGQKRPWHVNKLISEWERKVLASVSRAEVYFNLVHVALV